MSDELMSNDYWDNYWDSLFLPQKINLDFPTKCFLGAISKHLIKGDKTFLEVGCGAGKWMAYFYNEFGYKVFGSDYSKKACECGIRNLKLLNVLNEIYFDDLFYSKLSKNYFDVIFNTGFVEHFLEPKIPLEKMSELLSKDGLIITSVPNYVGIYGLIQKIFDKELYNAHKKISIEDLKKYHLDVGLKILFSGYSGVFASHAVNMSKFYNKHKWLSFFGKLIQRVLNHSVWSMMKILSCNKESKLFSPYVLVIARKE